MSTIHNANAEVAMTKIRSALECDDKYAVKSKPSVNTFAKDSLPQSPKAVNGLKLRELKNPS